MATSRRRADDDRATNRGWGISSARERAAAELRPSTLPKDVLISIEQTIPGGLEPEDWAVLMRVLDTIKGAIPPGSNAPPAEILNVIETALRAHFARQIEP
jgi:hypothetical protein